MKSVDSTDRERLVLRVGMKSSVGYMIDELEDARVSAEGHERLRHAVSEVLGIIGSRVWDDADSQAIAECVLVLEGGMKEEA